jgi:hypothetical protein
MTLKEYFAQNRGRGIIATADMEGNVNAAVYATPHILENGQVAFIMRDKLTHKNITDNPKAAYLFEVAGEGVSGIRLYLEKTAEEQDSPKLEELRRRKHNSAEEDGMSPKFLVYFKINRILPLLGDGNPGVSVE